MLYFRFWLAEVIRYSLMVMSAMVGSKVTRVSLMLTTALSRSSR